MEDCLAVTEERMLGVWQTRQLLRHTDWTPLFDPYAGRAVFGDPLDPINAPGIHEAVRAIAIATVVSPDVASERAAHTLRRVVVLSLQRGAPGEQRWLATAWRRIDPIGFAECAQQLTHAPYPGVEALPIDEAKQSIVNRLLASSHSDDRLVALRLMQSLET